VSRKKIFLILVALALSARLMREAYFHSIDLHVYWRAVHLWLDGVSPYIYDTSDGGNVYKYPPFTIPLFLPLGFISFDFTKWLWVIFEILSIGYCIKWVIRAGASAGVVLVDLAWSRFCGANFDLHDARGTLDRSTGRGPRDLSGEGVFSCDCF
jgi:hypothetical protein